MGTLVCFPSSVVFSDKIERPQNVCCHLKRFEVIKKHHESENATADAAFTLHVRSPLFSVFAFPVYEDFGCWRVGLLVTADCRLLSAHCH